MPTTPAPRHRPTRVPRVGLALASVIVLTVSACASGDPSGAPPITSPTPVSETADPTVPASSAPPGSPSSAPSAAAPSAAAAEPTVKVSGAELTDHIHNLGYDGLSLLIGTHDGLWVQEQGEQPARLSEDPFDVMGFARADDRWLASGHPGPGMDAPSDLGLLRSTDGGRTWSEVSLGGEVDFHRLVTSGPVVMGLNAHDGRLLRSEDDGGSWTDLGTPPLYDLALDPADGSVLVGTTPEGPVRSVDAGATFEPVADAPLLALLAWTGNALYGVDVDGAVYVSPDDGATWDPRGSVADQPLALTASGDRVSALVGNRIVESVDGGVSFSPRIVDIPAH